ncbi:ribonuclease III [Mesorhizobium sp. LHD-90]|uniref:ribonuclease III n=1 Tax=Mesorhizobium sp. LHD-90 TaxID=3071414 RepID=UPI0027E115A3|nr:ribonuclease III [Mesorhizobium sp. LHD-90]MDQ6438009.1 ribonuclease III [Mesorhizobium sp. LHD-90]
MGLKRPTGNALAAALQDRIGYAFRDSALLQTALTHSSAVKAKTNNERLEFLGDRVLGLVVADMLFSLFPEAREGDLAPRFNALVDARTCGAIGLELGLDTLIRADAALKAAKGGRTGNYLSDAVEALIAAIYLDGGMEPARAFIRRYWEPRSRHVVEKPRNPKSELQEWVAQANGTRPEYSIDAREGPDHQPVFTVSVRVDGFAPTSASGPSRRAAEEAAATEFLLREGVWSREGAVS